jgi:hypothetical protein
MSGDPEQEYFADGMVEEIITALSRFKSLFVIARNSSSQSERTFFKSPLPLPNQPLVKPGMTCSSGWAPTESCPTNGSS